MRGESGFQARARGWRRSIYNKILESKKQVSTTGTHSNTYIMTAHHADDQMESFLLKLLRGVHISHMHPVIMFCY
jgi:tRNA(Ile)-lysidine synthase TilS/MesJ